MAGTTKYKENSSELGSNHLLKLSVHTKWDAYSTFWPPDRGENTF